MNNHISVILDNILQSIQDGSIDMAIEELQKLLPAIDDIERKKEISLTVYRYHDLKQKERLDIVENIETKKNKIAHNIIGLVYEIKQSFTQNDNQILNDVAKRVIKVFLSDGNIYAVFSDGNTKQLTFQNSDSSPILSSKRGVILFVRTMQLFDEHSAFEIWQVDLDTLEETQIKKNEPYINSLGQNSTIHGLRHLSLSIDESAIYFICEKWVTQDALISINLDDKHWTEIGTSEFVKVVKYENQEYLLVSKLLEKDNTGSKNYWMLIDRKDNVIMEFESMVHAFQFLEKL